MALRILVTNDDGWDAEGLVVLKSVAAQLGDVVVLAPRDPHSYAGHRVTEDSALHLAETAPGEFSLSGTPADCVRVGLTSIFGYASTVLSGWGLGSLVQNYGWSKAFPCLIGIAVAGAALFAAALPVKPFGYGDREAA